MREVVQKYKFIIIMNLFVNKLKLKSEFEVVKSVYKICPNCTNFQLKSHRDNYCNVCGAQYVCNCPSCLEPIIYPLSNFCPVCGTNLKNKV